MAHIDFSLSTRCPNPRSLNFIGKPLILAWQPIKNQCSSFSNRTPYTPHAPLSNQATISLSSHQSKAAWTNAILGKTELELPSLSPKRQSMKPESLLFSHDTFQEYYCIQSHNQHWPSLTAAFPKNQIVTRWATSYVQGL